MSIGQFDGGATSTGSQAAWRLCLVASDILQLALFGLLLNFLLFGGTDIKWLIRGAMIGLIIFTVARHNVWLLLAAIQSSLFLREPQRVAIEHGVDSLLYCLAAIGAIAYASSLLMTRRHLGYWFAQSLIPLGGEQLAIVNSAIPNTDAPVDQKSGTPSEPQDAIDFGHMPNRPAALLTFRALMIVAAVLLSMLAFTHLPLSSDARQRWWLRSVDDGFTLWPGPTMLVLAIALVVLVWQSEWRQMTPPQARLMLRSTFLSIHYRDLKMIVTRRLRSSRKDAVKPSLDRSAATAPTLMEITHKH